MTAAVLYGSENLKIENVDIPTLAPDEALIRVKVALTCGTDLKVWKRGYHARMITPPAVFGLALAGAVEQVGPEAPETLLVRTAGMPGSSASTGCCVFCRMVSTQLCQEFFLDQGADA